MYIFENSSFLDLEPLAMIQNSCHFSCPLLIPRIRKFGSPWTSPSVNSQWYKNYKKWVLWYVLGSIIKILTSNTRQGMFTYSEDALHAFCFTCLVICKSAKKWYLMCVCISWLCPFNLQSGIRSHGYLTLVTACSEIRVILFSIEKEKRTLYLGCIPKNINYSLQHKEQVLILQFKTT